MSLDLRTLSYNVENLTPDAALELLRDFWIAARERRPDFKHILVISGPPGSGKSALTIELNRLITGREFLIWPYDYRRVADWAEEFKLIILDNFDANILNKRTKRILETAIALSSADSEYVSPRGKHVDTSNTYLIINCSEIPKWLDTNTMLHLHLNPWRHRD